MRSGKASFLNSSVSSITLTSSSASSRSFDDGNVHSDEENAPLASSQPITMQPKKQRVAISITYPNGTYDGQLNTLDQRHGRGTFVFNDAVGHVYEGDFQHDSMSGRGRYVFGNGDVYEGEFYNDVRHGRGIFQYANGDTYEGEFVNGVKCGRGIYRYANGDIYEGELRDDAKNGWGIYRYRNGDSYEGRWQNDKRQGRGTYKSVDGSAYEGQFRQDRRVDYGPSRLRTAPEQEGSGPPKKPEPQRRVDSFADGSMYTVMWRNKNGEGKTDRNSVRKVSASTFRVISNEEELDDINFGDRNDWGNLGSEGTVRLPDGNDAYEGILLDGKVMYAL